MRSEQPAYKRQWRDYQTESGARPIKDFLLALPEEDAADTQDSPEAGRTTTGGLATARQSKASWSGEVKERPMEQDFLDEMIDESTRKNSEFPSLMEEARQRRALLDALAAIRSRSRISQSAIAKRIKTSQSAIARLEAGIVDPRLSTVQRYAASVGKRIQWTLVDA
jgi:DNA-binding XRE family transcriptional regulator